jgi:release factor glutamine methyltransferase
MSGRMEARVLLREAIERLKASPAIDHWQRGRERIEAEELLAHVLGEDPDPRQRVAPRAAARFRALVARRARGEPLPYIKGWTEFRGLELRVRPGVFVPRDSSEFLAEQAIRRLRARRAPVLVDLATGIGTIALAVAKAVPGASVWGADVSAEAIAQARRNARRLGLRARFVVGDLFSPLPRRLLGGVDVITIHPPYVAAHELADLPEEIRAWEPEHTLTDHSADGLGIVSRTVREAPAWLRPNGWLLMEADPDRARDLRRVMVRGGFRDVRSTKGGALPITRVVVGRRPV